MKIRIGFVSNSSSSSFAIYGMTASSEGIIELLKNAGVKVPKKVENDHWEAYEWIQDKLSEVLAGTSLESNGGGEDGYYYIGRSLDSIGEDETGKQFKETTEADFRRVFPNNEKRKLAYEIGEVSC